MTANEWIIAVAGGALTVLNGWVGFWLKSIHSDFKKMMARQNEQQERLAILEFRVSRLDGDRVPDRRNTQP